MKGLTYGWVVVGLLSAVARAEMGELYCRQHNAALAPTDVSVTDRKYAPSREIDILHLAIDVTPDFKQRSIEAEVTLRFKPIAKALTELKLNAVDLTVSKVRSSDTMSGWHASDKEVVMAFDPPVPADKEATVNIRYSRTHTFGRKASRSKRGIGIRPSMHRMKNSRRRLRAGSPKGWWFSPMAR